jgi:hypothetical protein
MQCLLWQRIRRIVIGDDNPLRRHVDRLESMVAASLVIAFVVVAPLLTIVGVQAIGTAAGREQSAESTWRQVPATLTQSASAGLIGLDGQWDASWVTARWTAPDGAPVGGLLPIELNAKAGQRVMVWVTHTGGLTHAPLTSAEVIDREAIVALSVPAGLALLFWTTSRVVRAVANRRRMISWAKAWEAVGPRWSSLR